MHCVRGLLVWYRYLDHDHQFSLPGATGLLSASGVQILWSEPHSSSDLLSGTLSGCLSLKARCFLIGPH